MLPTGRVVPGDGLGRHIAERRAARPVSGAGILPRRPEGRELVPLAPQAQRAPPYVHEHLRARPRPRRGRPLVAARPVAVPWSAPSLPTRLRVAAVRLVPAEVVVHRRPPRAGDRPRG